MAISKFKKTSILLAALPALVLVGIGFYQHKSYQIKYVDYIEAPIIVEDIESIDKANGDQFFVILKTNFGNYKLSDEQYTNLTEQGSIRINEVYGVLYNFTLNNGEKRKCLKSLMIKGKTYIILAKRHDGNIPNGNIDPKVGVNIMKYSYLICREEK